MFVRVTCQVAGEEKVTNHDQYEAIRTEVHGPTDHTSFREKKDKLKVLCLMIVKEDTHWL